MNTPRAPDDPLFSVVVPAYNARDEIRASVASALDDTVPMEVVVIDDGSPVPIRPTDLPEGPVRLLRCERNGGTARARNRGIRAAKGTWIAFLDADDRYEPKRLSSATSFLAERSVDGLFTSTVIQTSDGRERTSTPKPNASGLISLRGQALVFASLIVRRTAFSEIGLFNPRWRLLEDVDLSIRLLTSGLRIAVMPGPAYVYRQHDESKTRALDQAIVLREERDIHLRNAVRSGLTLEERAVLLVRAARWQRWELQHRWKRFLDRGRSEP